MFALMKNAARRTCCKPLANRLGKEAASHPTFGRLILPIVGQANRRFTTKAQGQGDGHSNHGEKPPVTEEEEEEPFFFRWTEEEINDGLTKFIVYTALGAAVAAAPVLIWQRRSRLKAREEAMQRQQIDVHSGCSREELEELITLSTRELEDWGSRDFMGHEDSNKGSSK